ncbi:hypothetical protein Aduo_005591 [Ancylostoma duodenale]
MQVIPVYFWTGERVDLPCHMCELAMAYNGKVKYWAKAEDIGEFLEAPQMNVMSRKDLYKIVQNSEQMEDPEKSFDQPVSDATSFNMVPLSSTPGSEHIQTPPPVFLQRDGRLSIIRANPRSQGVYFCYDELSVGVTNVFYLVLAMTPPVSIFDSKPLHEESMQPYGEFLLILM